MFVATLAVVASVMVAAPASATAPLTPTLVAPADGTTSRTADPRLSVAVSDPDGDPLNVTFEGRIKGATVPGPTAGDPFTLMVIPDTQNYTTSSARTAIMTQQMQWIVDSRASLNTEFAVQVGDIVSVWGSASQWSNASAALKLLNDNGVPNAVVPGNHDFDNSTGEHAAYDTWFPPSRFQNASWTPSTARYGGYMGQNQFGPDADDRGNMNNYSLFTAGGVDWLALGLEWEASATVLDWADRVLAAHPDRQVIMFTHAFLNLPGARRTFAQRPGGTPPETTWQTFVRTHCQIRLVVNGHEHNGDLGESRRTDDNACGQPVHQILSDYQERANGGNGWLRYYRFDPAAGKMTAFTYSPYLDQFETDADSSFTLPFPLAPTVPAPFAPIATVSAPSGSVATTTWTGLPRNTDVEWRARVADGDATTVSPTWTVRTPPDSVLARDLFERTVVNGWGSADAGGAWTLAAIPSRYSVAGGAGVLTMANSSWVQANLASVSSANTRLTATFSVDKIAAAQYISFIGRQVGAEQYLLRVRVAADGTIQLLVMRGSGAIGSSFTVPGLVIAPGALYSIAFEVKGTSPTSLSGKMWRAASPEPAAWQLTRTDATAALQAPGNIGLTSYVPSAANAYPLKVSVTELTATDPTAAPPANQLPTASFTSTADDLAVSTDASASSDPDGTVASYAWAFGDGGTGSGVTTSHTYAAAGTYEITLTVTDADGGVSPPVTKTVTVTATPPVNQPPVAAFSATTTNLLASLDGSSSTDSDGVVASYGWTFGDSATATTTTATTSHTYAAAGTYTVTLTVTDDDGGVSAPVSKQVTVTAQAPALARDLFERTVANGWGSADAGGAWTVTAPLSRYAVAGGAGVLTIPNSSWVQANLTAVSSANTRLTASFSVDKIAAAQYISFIGRQVGAEQYLMRVRVAADGTIQLLMMRGSGAIGSSFTVPGLVIVPGTLYSIAFEVKGTSPTSLSGKMWRSASPEPATWQLTRTDATATLQAPGNVGLTSYVPTAANAYPLKISVAELTATDPTAN
ncbi:PKD domain-containing protein [Microbacterium terricola]|uniref:PKD domain-containing protein n=1 Tax=Microbacterium terricola TaxID=344163 RepID=A0ABM8E116_9MICO|nr:PKD domain-containing protein [Microbacterium terricola]UYK40633.1 PKD domain-containing protein [Microbacterium terricola]BDV31634.1 hypothetical protein Microterr_22940 [Microbacterium terricola]